MALSFFSFGAVLFDIIAIIFTIRLRKTTVLLSPSLTHSSDIFFRINEWQESSSTFRTLLLHTATVCVRLGTKQKKTTLRFVRLLTGNKLAHVWSHRGRECFFVICSEDVVVFYFVSSSSFFGTSKQTITTSSTHIYTYLYNHFLSFSSRCCHPGCYRFNTDRSK